MIYAPPSINWLIENQIILSKIYNWDAISLAEHMIDTNNLVNATDTPLVHTIWDFQDMATYPSNINDIRHAIQPLFTNERLGWVIVIVNNPMITFLAQVGSSMYGVRYRKFSTMDDAIKYLKERDPALAFPQ